MSTSSTEFEAIKAERDDLLMKYSKAQEHIQALKFSLESVIQTNISSSPVSSLEPNHYLNNPHPNGYSSLPRNLNQRQGSYPNSNNYFNNGSSYNGYSNDYEQPNAQYSTPNNTHSQRRRSTTSPNLILDPPTLSHPEYTSPSKSPNLNTSPTSQSSKLKYPSGHPRRQTFGDQNSPTDSELEMNNDHHHDYSEPEDLDSALRNLIQEKEKVITNIIATLVTC
jgi:hypothetical protein